MSVLLATVLTFPIMNYLLPEESSYKAVKMIFTAVGVGTTLAYLKETPYIHFHGLTIGETPGFHLFPTPEQIGR